MRNGLAAMLVWLVLIWTWTLSAQDGQRVANAGVPKPRLSCEEITGGLYIANAQLAEQLRDTAQKLQEAQAELEKMTRAGRAPEAAK